LKQRKDGRYEAKGIDSLGRRKSFYASSPGEAQRKANDSYGMDNIDTLYGYYCTAYLPTVEHRSQNWREQIAWAMDGYILPEFGMRDIASLTRPELQRFFNTLGKRLAPSSIRRVKIVLSGILNLAEEDEAIPKNTARRVRTPVPGPSDKTALSAVELWQLISRCEDRIRPFVILAGACGLRAGEALAVTRAHLSGGVLSVRQQVLQPKGGCIVTKTLKTAESYRRIPLPTPMLEMLLGCGQKSGIWVCSNVDGGYMTPNNASRDLGFAVDMAEVQRVTPHELRHTFITLLESDLEAPPAIAAALAGKRYAGPNKGYVHPSPARLKQWMEKLWSHLSTSVTTIECRQESQNAG
jgi:integrase